MSRFFIKKKNTLNYLLTKQSVHRSVIESQIAKIENWKQCRRILWTNDNFSLPRWWTFSKTALEN